MPVRSEGSRSGVAWTRLNVPWIDPAMARASMVLPTPGTPSSRRFPSANRQTTAASTASRLPAITRSTLSTTRRSAADVRTRSGSVESIPRQSSTRHGPRLNRGKSGQSGMDDSAQRRSQERLTQQALDQEGREDSTMDHHRHRQRSAPLEGERQSDAVDEYGRHDDWIHMHESEESRRYHDCGNDRVSRPQTSVEDPSEETLLPDRNDDQLHHTRDYPRTVRERL